MKRRLYSRWGLRNVYDQLKAENPGCLLAFGVGEFFFFILAHARTVKAALPDVEVVQEYGGDAVRVHAAGFWQLCARLEAKGLKAAMVSRAVRSNNTVGYAVSFR